MIHRDSCAACGGRELYKMMDLGDMPNANNLVPKDQLDSVKVYPLVYYWCSECNLLQQLDMAEREELFNDRYTYVTGVSRTIVEHYRKLAQTITEKAGRDISALVIASNDGTEISALREAGLRKVIGVEPSANLARMSMEKGNETINAFFDEEFSRKFSEEHGKVEVVVANNVLAHIPNPEGMLRGIRNVLTDNGHASIEVHWLKSLVNGVEIDTLYAEHYFVWTVKAMKILAESCGLAIEGIEYLPTPQAGSLRYWLRPKEAQMDFAKSQGAIDEFVGEERKEGVDDSERMKMLSVKANERKRKLVDLITRLRNEGKEITLWTAPAKMSTILNYCNLTNKEIKCAYDGSPYKIGMYIPKANIPVIDEKLLRASDDGKLPSDYMMIGAWNLMELAREKLSWYVEKGGKLINPLTVEVE